jgi:hypothetical protein
MVHIGYRHPYDFETHQYSKAIEELSVVSQLRICISTFLQKTPQTDMVNVGTERYV